MSGFDENIVREYFELHGFLVRQVRKYQVQARRKVAEEEIDLLVKNVETWTSTGSLVFVTAFTDLCGFLFLLGLASALLLRGGP